MTTLSRIGLFSLFVFYTLLTSSITSAVELSQEQVEKMEFDLVGIALFGGKDPVSKVIKLVTGSDYSHVGIILSNKEDPTDWYCFESTGSQEEVLSGVLPHVRVTPWDEVATEYPGSVTTRCIAFEEEHKPSCEDVTNFVRKHNGEDYEKDPRELFLSLLDKNSESDLSSLFCSELAAAMLMHLGLMKEGPSNNWLPCEFSAEHDEQLQLINAVFQDQNAIKAMPAGSSCCCIIL